MQGQGQTPGNGEECDRCLIGRDIQDALEGFYAEAGAALEEKLARKSIADVVESVLARASQCAG
ncbi:MAG: hypothetical protein JOZ41_16740 [Chloroflexi bacterium]|nr:hypothetical protein [Chloroflexota bacterium]